MRYLLPLLLALCASTAAQAFDLTTQSLVIAGYATSKVTTAPFFLLRIRVSRHVLSSGAVVTEPIGSGMSATG